MELIVKMVEIQLEQLELVPVTVQMDSQETIVRMHQLVKNYQEGRLAKMEEQ
jgi:hypothetical protein